MKNLRYLAGLLIVLLGTVTQARIVDVAGANNADITATLNNAIVSSAPGDTIRILAGTHILSSTVTLRSDRTYIGDGVATLKNTGNFQMFTAPNGVKNIVIKNLYFDGACITLENSGDGTGVVDGVVIDNCHFAVRNLGEHARYGVLFESGRIKNVQITNNVFDPIQGDSGIYGYYATNLLVANNEFKNGLEGCHVIDHSNSSTGLIIEQNFCSGLSRLAIEVQGGWRGAIIQDNWYESPVLSSINANNLSCFAFSIPAAESDHNIVRRNVGLAPLKPDGQGMRCFIELGGTNVDCYDNYGDGGYNGISATGANGTGKAHDNKLQNYGASNAANTYPGMYNLANANTTTFTTNGPLVTLTFDPFTRGRPFPNKRYGAAPTPNPPPPPVDPPVTSPTYDLTAVLADNNTATITLGATPPGSTTVTIETISTVGREVGTKVGPSPTYTLPKAGAFALFGYHQGWQIDTRAVYHDGSGVMTGTTPYHTLTFGGDPTAPWPAAVARPADNRVWLSSLPLVQVLNGEGNFEIDKSVNTVAPNDGSPLTVGLGTYDKGLGVASNSDVKVQLNRKYDTFLATVGVDGEVYNKGSVVFQVWADGVKLWESPTVHGGDSPVVCSVNVAGRTEMHLVTTDAGDGTDNDHADWAFAGLIQTTPTSTRTLTKSTLTLEYSDGTKETITRP
jgi:hypothetical protein